MAWRSTAATAAGGSRNTRWRDIAQGATRRSMKTARQPGEDRVITNGFSLHWLRSLMITPWPRARPKAAMQAPARQDAVSAGSLRRFSSCSQTTSCSMSGSETQARPAASSRRTSSVEPVRPGREHEAWLQGGPAQADTGQLLERHGHDFRCQPPLMREEKRRRKQPCEVRRLMQREQHPLIFIAGAVGQCRAGKMWLLGRRFPGELEIRGPKRSWAALPVWKESCNDGLDDACGSGLAGRSRRRLRFGPDNERG